MGTRQKSSVSLNNALMKIIQAIAKIQHGFNDFAENHDYQISLEEFLEECNMLETTLPTTRLLGLFRVTVIDANEDGYLSREE